jgi:hypothetical protein
MADITDKRLHGQETALKGATWVYRHYRRHLKNNEWNRDNCCLCGMQFAGEYPEITDEGYTTLSGHHTICERCFQDFKDILGWSIHNWD